MGAARVLMLLLVMSVAYKAAHAQTCSATDGFGLSYFSREVPQSGSLFATWIDGTNCCNWAGVTCNGAGRVTSLVLNKTDIATVAPPGEQYTICTGLGDLAALENLSVINVGLNGKLPTTIGGLKSLKTLIFDGCNLVGPIPEEYCALNLETFIMKGNLLESYPSCFDSKASITTIDLTGNRFSGGPKRP